MAPLTTFLFDLDGTLLDSIRLILDSYHHTLRVHGLRPRSDAEWLAGIGTPLRVQFREWAQDPKAMDAMVATYRDFNLSHHDTMASAYPGVVAAVKEVHGRGIRMGLVTSKNRAGAERGLKLLGLDREIPLIVGADDVENPKPHPEPVLKALAQLGVAPEEAVYIGDSVHDMHSGKAAGVRTAAVLWGPFGRQDLAHTEPTWWLERPAELLELGAKS
jgi:pyrophosphatase PpaX